MTDWRHYYDQKYEREQAEFERQTNERIAQNNARLDVEFAMIDASEQLRLDEALAGKSDEYRRGFEAGRMFQVETMHAILNA